VDKYSEILVIKSDNSEINKVESFLTDIFNKFYLDKNQFNRVFLCISEAIINSIYHGNRNNFYKDVNIHIVCKECKMYIEISDEGIGFDHTKIENPTEGINIRKESGRGLHIIKSLCDHIEFKNQGSCIKIIFKVR